MAENPEIFYRDSLVNKKAPHSDEGYQEVVNYLAGDIVVEADGKRHLVKNQGAYQTPYIITSNDVHHSRQGFPNIRAESSVNDASELLFYPYSTIPCDMQGRLRMKKSESHFHYHNGRQVRLILRGRIKVQWIQLNKLHEVELGEDDWIVIPANTPYKTVVLEPADILSNWVSFATDITTNKFNTIGRYERAPESRPVPGDKFHGDGIVEIREPTKAAVVKPTRT